MPRTLKPHKITKVSVPKLRRSAGVSPADPGTSRPRVQAALLRRHQRMRNGMHRQGDPVLHADLAHQFRYVRFHRALFDS
jgi:hypothetical protein